jgi:hypothetical protein
VESAVEGPAVIELSGTTILVNAGQRLERHATGSFVIQDSTI